VSTEQLRVLVVCTGNIGRSPMMERLLRRDLAAAGLGDVVDVSGAGTWARDGHPMEPYAEQVLRERAADPADFAARALTQQLVAGSDLVLTATREHRGEVVNLVPAAVRRTFTLLELARVVDRLPTAPGPVPSDPVGRMRGSVAWASQNRVPADTDDDLADPLGAPVDTYRHRADQIETAGAKVVTLLSGTWWNSP
jgi:protein-tyrosine phosphatase